MFRWNNKPVIWSTFLSVLILFFALGTSYMDIEKKSEQNRIYTEGLAKTINTLVEENSQLKGELKSSRAMEGADGLIYELMRISLLDHSKIERAMEIARDTPLDFKSAMVLIDYSETYGVEPSLVLAIIKKESNFNGQLVGTHKDRGFMQIIPSTEKWLAATYGNELGLPYNPDLIFTPEYNLGLGIRYISLLLSEYQDPHRALSEYNRGYQKLADYYAANKTYQTSYSKTIVAQAKQFEQYND